MKLIFGCGRAHQVHYNPLYQPRPGERVVPGSPLADAIASRQIVVEGLCHHDDADVFTVDIDALKIPSFTGNVKDTAVLKRLETQLKGRKFDEIELEKFPYDTLVSGDGGERFFHCCYLLLNVQGTLTISTGPGVSTNGSHERIASALKRAGFGVEHGPTLGGYQFTAKITFRFLQ